MALTAFLGVFCSESLVHSQWVDCVSISGLRASSLLFAQLGQFVAE